MACKLVVRRFSAGLDFIGDVVNAYPFDKYLGKAVEPQGGAFVIIEVNDCEYTHPEIQALIECYDNPTSRNKKQSLTPVKDGDEFFYELLTTGRINVSLNKLLEYRVFNNG